MRTTLLDEIGDLSAPPGSHSWAVAMRRELQAALSDKETSAEHAGSLLELFQDHHGYRELVNREGRPFVSFEDFYTTKYPWGLGHKLTDIDRIVRERRDRGASERAESAKPLLGGEALKEARAAGGSKGGRGKRNLVANGHKVKTNQLGSNSAERLTNRIARDRPDILDRMKKGEFPSVRAAAKAAGIVKESFHCPLDVEGAAKLLRKHFTGERWEELRRAIERDLIGVEA